MYNHCFITNFTLAVSMLSFVVLVSKDGVYLSSAVVPLYTGFVEGKVILYSFFKFEYSL